MVHIKNPFKGKAWIFSRPYHGPYRVVTVIETIAEIRLVITIIQKMFFMQTKPLMVRVLTCRA